MHKIFRINLKPYKDFKIAPYSARGFLPGSALCNLKRNQYDNMNVSEEWGCYVGAGVVAGNRTK